MPAAVSGLRAAPWPAPMSNHGQGDGPQVGAVGRQAAEPEHAENGVRHAGGEQEPVTEPVRQTRDGQGNGEVDERHRQERDPGLQRAVSEDALQEP